MMLLRDRKALVSSASGKESMLLFSASCMGSPHGLTVQLWERELYSEKHGIMGWWFGGKVLGFAKSGEGMKNLRMSQTQIHGKESW